MLSPICWSMTPPPPTPPRPRQLPPAVPTRPIAATLVAVTTAPSVGDEIVVPSSVWPQYRCKENGGAGLGRGGAVGLQAHGGG